jgi:tRNA C32,U32 (ribose-2'-O)-methylase TrmJ
LAALDQTIEVSEVEGWDMPLADAEDVERMHQHMAQTLAAINFIDLDNPKQALNRLRRMFARTRLDKMEVSILRGMLNKIDKLAAKNKTN